MRDAWEILGIQPTENKRVIKKAYAAKLAQYHPEDFPQEFAEIQDAYNTIMNAFTREYGVETNQHIQLEDAFKKKDSIYTVNLNSQEHEPERLQEIILEDVLLEKQPSETRMDELNLDWSFRNLDEAQGQKKSGNDDISYELIQEEQGQSHKDRTAEADYAYSLENDPLLQQDKQSSELDVSFTLKQEEQGQSQENRTVETDDTYTMEDASTSQQEVSERLLSDLYYHKFQERLRYQPTLGVLKSLILNEAFFLRMKDPYFYEKVSSLLCNQLTTFHAVTLSFLYDAFHVIKDHYHYSSEEYDVPYAIQNYIGKKRAIAKRKRIYKIITIPAFLLFFIIMTTYQTNMKLQKNEKSLERLNNRQEVVITPSKDSIEDMMDEANNTLNTALQESYAITYRCNLNATFTGYDQTVLYFCQDEEVKYYGNVTFDIDGTVTSLSVPEAIGEKE